MSLKEILKKADWKDVANSLLSSHPKERKYLAGYEQVFEGLRQMTPMESDVTLVIEYIEDDLDPGHFYYDLYGRKEGDDRRWGLLFTPWPEWMGMEVSEETVSALTPAQIIAHCLYEITFCGFSEAAVAKEREKTLGIAEDVSDFSETLEEWMPEQEVEISMKSRLMGLNKWLRWSSVAKEYYGKSFSWFKENFIGKEAPDRFPELERYTLKAALKEIAHNIEIAADDL